MPLPCFSPKVSLSKNILRLKRMKELKGHFCLFFLKKIFFFRYKLQEEMARICIRGGRMKLPGRTRRVWVTVFLIKISWSSQIFPVPARLFSSYIFSLQAENYTDLSLPGRKQKVSLELSHEIMVTGQCLFLQLHKNLSQKFLIPVVNWNYSPQSPFLSQPQN